MQETIICKYSCGLCGIKDAEVAVLIREKDQCIVDWVQSNVIVALASHYQANSPNCDPTELQDLMIPVPDGTAIIGRPVEH